MTLPTVPERDRGLDVARWSLLLTVFLVPVVTSNFTWLGFPSPFTANQFDLVKLLVMQVGLLAGFAGWLAHLSRRQAAVRWSPWLWLALSALVLTTASALLSPMPAAAVLGRDPRFMGLLTLADFLAAFYLSAQCFDTAEQKRRLAVVLASSAALVAGYAVLQYFGLDPIAWGAQTFDTTRVSSTLGNPVPLGGFLVGSLSVTLALALAESEGRVKVGAWVSAGLQALALMLTFTRGAWLGMAGALVVLGVVAWRASARPARIDLVAAAACLVLVAAVGALTLSSRNADTNVATRLASTANVEAGSSGERLLVWGTALRAIGERPLQGWGPEGFRWAYARLRAAEAVRLNGPVALADDAHNYPLQLAATLGVPAALATLALLLAAAWLGAASAIGMPAGGRLPLRAGYLAALLGTLAYLMTGISSSASVVFLWLYAGVLLPTTPSRDERRVIVGRVVGGLAVVLGACALVAVVAAVRGDALYVKGRTSASLEERIAYYAAASKAAPRSDAFAESLGNMYATAAQQAIAQARSLESAGNDPSPAVQAAGDYLAKGASALARAIAVAPLEPTNYLDAARLYLLSGTNLNEGDLAKAENYAAEGLKRSPLSPRLLSVQARILLAEKRSSEALAPAEKAVALYRDVDSLAALGEARLANGDMAGAVSAFSEALKVAPDDPGIKAQLEAARKADVPQR